MFMLGVKHVKIKIHLFAKTCNVDTYIYNFQVFNHQSIVIVIKIDRFSQLSIMFGTTLSVKAVKKSLS